MSETAELLLQTVDRLFDDNISVELLNAAESGAWPSDLWREIEALGLPALLTMESEGEIGWREAFAVIRAVGRKALPLPLGECVVAGWLLKSTGLESAPGPIGLASGPSLRLTQDNAGWRLHGEATRTPWGRNLTTTVAVVKHGDAGYAVAAPVTDAAIVHGANLAGEPRDRLTFDGCLVQAASVRSELGDDPCQTLGAAVRAAQISGAVEAVLQMSVGYARERRQFGRLIGGFQAVQQQLAVLAGEAAAAAMAAEQAFIAMDEGRARDFWIATAKIRAGKAAGTAAAIGHQVHGAMGFAREHRLHFATRRLWAWRTEYGAERDWACRLGKAVIQSHAESPWPFVTAPSDFLMEIRS